MKSLFAFYEQKKVGVLTIDDDAVYSFEYEKAWQQDPLAFPISFSMPLDQKKFGNKISLSYFENLLPEGKVLKDLEKSQGIQGTFELLARFGKDCAGAIILTPHEEGHFPFSKELIPLDMNEINLAIDEKRPITDVVLDMNPGYLSIAGAQDKFPVVFKDNKFYLPMNGAPTTHIVKAPIWRRGIRESVYNEYFCMELARAIGFSIPPCEVVNGDHPLYMIQRYDRFADEKGRIHRLPQQDLCQAQGYASAHKYESKGGPSIKQNYDFLMQHLSPQVRLRGVETFLRWICFNLMIGNNDSHSKNISLLFNQERKYSVAPLYDLLSTAIYPILEQEFSFRIGGRDEFSKIGKNQIGQLETELSLKRGTFQNILQEMGREIKKAKEALSEKMIANHPEAKIIPKICELIDGRIKSLRIQKAIA